MARAARSAAVAFVVAALVLTAIELHFVNLTFDDAFISFRRRNDRGPASVRVWLTVDGVGIGVWPGWIADQWYATAGGRLRGHLPDGVAFYRLRTGTAEYRFEHVGSEPPGTAFLAGRWYASDDTTTADFASTIIAAATVIGFGLGFTGIDAIHMLVWSAVLNGIVAVPIMAMMMAIVSNTKLMGRYKARSWLVILGWLGTALMAVAVIALFSSFLL